MGFWLADELRMMNIGKRGDFMYPSFLKIFIKKGCTKQYIYNPKIQNHCLKVGLL